MKTIWLGEEYDDWARHSYKVEIEILKQIEFKTLPYLVDLFETEGKLCIVMEYIHGVTLEQWINKYGPMNQGCIIEYGLNLTNTVRYLHNFQPAIIYGDMKPSNIMLKPNGSIKLIDFGSALQKNIVCEEIHYFSGTKGYAPPELCGPVSKMVGRKMDERGDIYSLGATLFHMATGIHPRIEGNTLEAASNINPKISVGLENIIAKSTKRNVLKRYQKIEEMELDLKNERIKMGRGFKKELRESKKKLMYQLLTIVIVGIIIVGYKGKDYSEKNNYLKYESCQVPVTLYDRLGRKILIKEDSVLYTNEKIIFILSEVGQRYWVSVNDVNWYKLTGVKYQLDVAKSLVEGEVTKIVFVSLNNESKEPISKTFLVCYEDDLGDS